MNAKLKNQWSFKNTKQSRFSLGSCSCSNFELHSWAAEWCRDAAKTFWSRDWGTAAVCMTKWFNVLSGSPKCQPALLPWNSYLWLWNKIQCETTVRSRDRFRIRKWNVNVFLPRLVLFNLMIEKLNYGEFLSFWRINHCVVYPRLFILLPLLPHLARLLCRGWVFSSLSVILTGIYCRCRYCANSLADNRDRDVTLSKR